jgi:hypothetical protein
MLITRVNHLVNLAKKQEQYVPQVARKTTFGAAPRVMPWRQLQQDTPQYRPNCWSTWAQGELD